MYGLVNTNYVQKYESYQYVQLVFHVLNPKMRKFFMFARKRQFFVIFMFSLRTLIIIISACFFCLQYLNDCQKI